MRRAVAIFLLLTAACTPGIDRKLFTQLEPAGPGQYRYIAKAGISYPVDDPKAEATRLRWLGEVMSTARACPGGYTVTDRQGVIEGPFVTRLYYTVRCT